MFDNAHYKRLLIIFKGYCQKNLFQLIAFFLLICSCTNRLLNCCGTGLRSKKTKLDLVTCKRLITYFFSIFPTHAWIFKNSPTRIYGSKADWKVKPELFVSGFYFSAGMFNITLHPSNATCMSYHFHYKQPACLGLKLSLYAINISDLEWINVK